MPDLFTELKNFKLLFEPKIQSLFEEEKSFAKKINPVGLDSLVKIEKLTMLGGKRFRPFLVYLGYKLFNTTIDQADLDRLLLVGSSLEVFHSFCLVHDDIIDEAVVRRGLPTVEKEYENEFRDSVLNYKHLGISAGILAGDFAYVLSNKWFLKVANRSLELEKMFYQMQVEVCYGQMDDTFGTGICGLQNLSQDQVLNMLSYKSGKYSIEKPLLIGAILTGADSQQLSVLSQVGTDFGLAFQIVDDVLGVFGADKVTGKSSSGDILEGKRTFLVYTAYQKSSPEEKEKMSALLGKKDIAEEEINWFKNHLESTNAKKETLGFAQKLIQDSSSLLQKTFDNSPNLSLLVELGEYLLKRDI